MTSLFYSDRLKNKNKYLGRPLPLAAGSSTASTAPWAPAAGGLWPGHRGRRAGDGQGKEAPGRKEVCLRHSWGASIAVQANCTDVALAVEQQAASPTSGTRTVPSAGPDRPHAAPHPAGRPMALPSSPLPRCGRRAAPPVPPAPISHTSAFFYPLPPPPSPLGDDSAL